MSNEVVKKIKMLDRTVSATYVFVEKRAFWILCYCYFVNGKDEVVHWKQLEEAKLMGNEALDRYLSSLTTDGYLKKYRLHSEKFYKITAKAKQLMEQQLKESEILLELRCMH